MLAVDRIKYQNPSWDQVKRVIRFALLQDTSSGSWLVGDSSSIIMQLEIKITEFKTDGLPADVKRTIDTFRSIINGEAGRFYTVGSHAEALLGSLIKFSHVLATGDPSLDEFCQVRIYLFQNTY